MDWDTVKSYELDILEAVAAVAFGMAITNLYYLYINDANGVYILLVLIAVGSIMLALSAVKAVNQCEKQGEAIKQQFAALEERFDHLSTQDSTDESPLERTDTPFEFNQQAAESPKATLERLFDDESD